MRIIETKLAPNPRRVRIFLAEKGVSMTFEERDLMAGVLNDPDFAALNAWQRVPVLILDDGRVLSETLAICRYFEALHPEPSLFGRDPFESATVEMWQRRVELGLFTHVTHVLRHLHPKMAALEAPQIAAWGEANKDKAALELERLDMRLAQVPFLAGDDYSVADITALVAIDFMKPARLRVPETCVNVRRWYAAVAARPSASA